MLTLYRIKFTSKNKSYGGVAYLACEKNNILPSTELILEAVGKENMDELALKGVTDEGPVYVVTPATTTRGQIERPLDFALAYCA